MCVREVYTCVSVIGVSMGSMWYIYVYECVKCVNTLVCLLKGEIGGVGIGKAFCKW